MYYGKDCNYSTVLGRACERARIKQEASASLIAEQDTGLHGKVLDKHTEEERAVFDVDVCFRLATWYC
jgi:hypothetical protein